MPGALGRRMLLVDPLLSQSRPCSSRIPAPGQRSPVASWRLLPSIPPLAAKVGSLAATLHHSAPLLLSLFLPDTQLLLCIWITFPCYGILVVFPIPPFFPLPFSVAGLLRGRVFGESCKHICSLAVAFQEGLVRGSGRRQPGHARRWRLAGGVQGPWHSRPAAGTLTVAGRAEPPGLWALRKSWSHSWPAPRPRRLWLLALSAQIEYARLGVGEK